MSGFFYRYHFSEISEINAIAKTGYSDAKVIRPLDYTKIHSEGIKDLIVRSKAVKLLGEKKKKKNIEEKFLDSDLEIDFGYDVKSTNNKSKNK